VGGRARTSFGVIQWREANPIRKDLKRTSRGWAEKGKDGEVEKEQGYDSVCRGIVAPACKPSWEGKKKKEVRQKECGKRKGVGPAGGKEAAGGV